MGTELQMLTMSDSRNSHGVYCLPQRKGIGIFTREEPHKFGLTEMLSPKFIHSWLTVVSHERSAWTSSNFRNKLPRSGQSPIIPIYFSWMAILNWCNLSMLGSRSQTQEIPFIQSDFNLATRTCDTNLQRCRFTQSVCVCCCRCPPMASPLDSMATEFSPPSEIHAIEFGSESPFLQLVRENSANIPDTHENSIQFLVWVVSHSDRRACNFRFIFLWVRKWVGERERERVRFSFARQNSFRKFHQFRFQLIQLELCGCATNDYLLTPAAPVLTPCFRSNLQFSIPENSQFIRVPKWTPRFRNVTQFLDCSISMTSSRRSQITSQRNFPSSDERKTNKWLEFHNACNGTFSPNSPCVSLSLIALRMPNGSLYSPMQFCLLENVRKNAAIGSVFLLEKSPIDGRQIDRRNLLNKCSDDTTLLWWKCFWVGPRPISRFFHKFALRNRSRRISATILHFDTT